MHDYRLFSISDAPLAMRMDDFEASSDEDAVRIARAMEKKGHCELWNGDRMVATIPPQQTSRPSQGGKIRRLPATGHRASGR